MSLRSPPLLRSAKARTLGIGRLAAVLAALTVGATLPSISQAKDTAKTAARHRAAVRLAVEPLPNPAGEGAVARIGIASVYAHQLAGRRMANGAPMRLDRHHAASLTLPLGSTAVVTNLANGARAVVTITDRGPFVRGRIIDLTPHTATLLGIRHLARVEVAPIAPAPDDRVDLALAVTNRDEASLPR